MALLSLSLPKMSERKYGFFKLEDDMTSMILALQESIEEFKEWVFKEIQGFKEELRELRRKIDEVEGQVV